VDRHKDIKYSSFDRHYYFRVFLRKIVIVLLVNFLFFWQLLYLELDSKDLSLLFKMSDQKAYKPSPWQ